MNKKIEHISPRTWRMVLASGKYKRVRGALGSQEKGMCCLGVYKELVGGLEPDYSAYLGDSAPDWLSSVAQGELAAKNDAQEGVPGRWQTPAENPEGVLAYMDEVVIPAYDEWRKQ